MKSLARISIFIGGLVAFLMSMTPSAWAVPSYTRRYGVECATCHTVWGALTAAGNTFKLSGYRAIMGVDLKPDTEDLEIAHGSLAIPTTLPLSFITGFGYDSRKEKRDFSTVNPQGNTAGDIQAAVNNQSGSSFAIEDASIFLTSPLGKYLAAFVEFPMYETRAWEFTPTGFSSLYAKNYAVAGNNGQGPTSRNIKFGTENPTFEVAKFFWNNILGDSAPRDSVNLLFGITHLPLAYSPGKVRLPVNQDLIYERRALDLIGKTPTKTLFGDADDDLFRLSEPQGVLGLFGMFVPGGSVTDVKNSPWIEYHAGFSNGSNSKADNNTQKDVYGRITLRGRGQSLGLFGYHSQDTYSDDMRTGASIASGLANGWAGVMSGDQTANKHTTFGPNFTLSLAPFGVPLWLDNDILYRRESNPTGFGVEFKWKGGFHQLNWQASKQTMAYLRYDWIHGDRFDDTRQIVNGVNGVTLVEPREKDYVLGVQHLVAPNLKFIGEFRNHRFEDLAGAGKLTDNGLTVRFMIGF